MSDTNPYASPQVTDNPTSVLGSVAVRPYAERFLWALGRWTIICGISAAPSFLIWYGGSRGALHVLAMLSGIGVFVVTYALVECSRWYERIRQRPHVRTTFYVGYMSRMLLSLLPLLFQPAIVVDMVAGMVAVATVEAVGGDVNFDRASTSEPVVTTFLSVFATTIIEGLLLNIILVGYMAPVFGLLCVARPGINRRKVPAYVAFPTTTGD